jgi:hypothetical protein
MTETDNHRQLTQLTQRTEKEEARCPNSVYVTIAGEVVIRKLVLLRNFVLHIQEIASNPLLHIHANRQTV